MSQKEKQTLVLIDGNAIIHRAYHALPPMTRKGGEPVHAVYGFATMLLRVIDELAPTHMAVAFDVAGGTFRDKVFEDYKAHRVAADKELYDQIPLAHDLVRAFGIPIYTKEGFEADDIIGTIATHAPEDMAVIIVTGDKDLLQLVNSRIQVYLLRKGLSDTRLVDRDGVRDIYGFFPEYVRTYKALAGDSSDNIPGVSGIGEKGAKDLIASGGDLDSIYAAGEALIEKGVKAGLIKKLLADEKGARMSFQLATIHTDVPEVDFSPAALDFSGIKKETLVPFLQEMEFSSLVRRLSIQGSLQKTKQDSKEEKRIVNASDILGLVRASEQIFLRLVGPDVYFLAQNILYACAADDFFSVLLKTEKLCTIVCHDSKKIFRLYPSLSFVDQVSFVDLMILSYIENASTRSHDAENIVSRITGKVFAERAQTLFGFDAEYEKEVLFGFPAVYEYMQKALGKEEWKLLYSVEQPLVPVLAAMERDGMLLDKKKLDELSHSVAKTIAEVSRRIWNYAGKEFNISSSVQLRDILFETLALPAEGIKKGKTGLSTAQSELEKLRGQHPIISDIEEYRELEKLRNTYIDVLPGLLDVAGRVHTTYNQTVAATGRLSSSDPNVQNIPVRTALGRDIRKAFIASPGYTLLCADYSQIELRIVASIAKDETMVDVFSRGEDIHTATAAAIHGVKIEEVTKDMRRSAKEINFGVLYGMGAYGLSARTGLSPFEAEKFIQAYFARFKGVKRYVDETLIFAREHGYVETLFGRKRYIPELQAENKQMRMAGERMAVNMPVQGTAADMIKLAMIALFRDFYNKEIKSENANIRMLLQVHDELVFEVRQGKESEYLSRVKKIMEEVVSLAVPVVVEVGIGQNWDDAK